MALQAFELINVMDTEFKRLWIDELLKDNYHIQKLQLEINSNNTSWVDESMIKKMMLFNDITYEIDLTTSLSRIPLKFNEDIPSMYKHENITRQFLNLITKLKHTNSPSKIYKLLYDYFSRVKDPVSIKWSLEILLNKEKVREMLI